MTSSRQLTWMCRRVASTLDRETRALIEGRFSDLSHTQVDRNHLIEKLLKEVEGVRDDGRTLSAAEHRELLSAVDSVRTAAMRNGAALSGALRGLKAGRARLDEWLSGPSSVAAYGANGARPQSSVATGRTTKRV